MLRRRRVCSRAHLWVCSSCCIQFLHAM